MGFSYVSSFFIFNFDRLNFHVTIHYEEPLFIQSIFMWPLAFKYCFLDLNFSRGLVHILNNQIGPNTLLRKYPMFLFCSEKQGMFSNFSPSFCFFCIFKTQKEIGLTVSQRVCQFLSRKTLKELPFGFGAVPVKLLVGIDTQNCMISFRRIIWFYHWLR